ncbi:hypothetical protein ACFE04_013006 [Oxalis oulophora]
MADLISGTIEILLGTLTKVAYDEISSAWGVKTDLQKLKATLLTIQAVLLDAEEQQAHSRVLRDWLHKLKNVCYDIEDVLDLFEVETLTKQVIAVHGRFLEKSQFNLREIAGNQRPVVLRDKETHSYVEPNEMKEDNKAQKIPDIWRFPILKFKGLKFGKFIFESAAIFNWYFETTAVSQFRELEELPKDMKYMISLRVLALTTKQKSLSETGIECLKSLRALELEDCKNLEYLFAGMECPPALETLAISNCPMLISLPRALKCLTSLKILHIENCQELDLGMKFESEDDHQDVNTMLSIRIFSICHLPKLINFPSWLLRGSLKSLEVIQLNDCENLTGVPESLPSFTSLEELYIIRCPSLETLPRGMNRLTSLKKLCMIYCESLNLSLKEEHDKHQLSGSKLEKLAIIGLPKLTTLPQWLLQWSMLSLETLWIENCQQLKMLPAVIQSLTFLKRMEFLPALQTLFIANSPSLTTLPRGLKCLTSLTTLATIGFGGCRELNLEINSESEDDHQDVNNLVQP